MKNKKQYLIQLLLIGIFCFIPSLMVGQTYKIYSTRNCYNQLRLNTMTGEVHNDNTEDMWKFQWSTKGDDYRWIEKFK